MQAPRGKPGARPKHQVGGGASGPRASSVCVHAGDCYWGRHLSTSSMCLCAPEMQGVEQRKRGGNSRQQERRRTGQDAG